MVRLSNTAVVGQTLVLGCYFAVASASSGSAVVSLVKGQGNGWYGTFSVGSNKSQELYIDTATPAVEMPLDDYSRGPNAQHLNENTKAPLMYKGHEYKILFEIYKDTVGVQNLVVDGLELSIVAKSTPPGYEYLKAPRGTMGLGFLQQGEYVKQSFVQSLCIEKKISECRFGLALEPTKSGKLVLGELDSSMYQGDLQTFSLQADEAEFGYALKGGMTVSNKAWGNTQFFQIAAGNPKITVPMNYTEQLFKDLGITKSKRSTKYNVIGEFPCDKVPKLGFKFAGGANMNIDEDAMIYKKLGGGQCEAAIEGFNQQGDNVQFWSIGSPFFEGRYTDFDVTSKKIGFATLKDSNPTGAAASSKSLMSISQGLMAAGALGAYLFL